MTFFWYVTFLVSSSIIAGWLLFRRDESAREDILRLLEINLKLKKALVDARHSLKIIREWDDDSEYEWEDPGVCAADGIKKINEALREI